jgi:hypothetical protein
VHGFSVVIRTLQLETLGATKYQGKAAINPADQERLSFDVVQFSIFKNCP